MQYGVYARVKKSFVTFVDEVFSSRFKEPTEEDILIEEGEGERFIRPKYIIYDMQFLHNYKIVNGKIVETTKADKRKEQGLMPEPEETPEQKIEGNTFEIYQLSEQLLNTETELLLKIQEVEDTKQELVLAKAELEEQKIANGELNNYVLDLDARITNIENL